MAWEFWVDRGGTFTDIVAQDPSGALHSHKLLSENPEQYKDAAVAGIRHILADTDLETADIAAVKMGTTVATNALLERKGARVLLMITEGFGDLLEIGYQTRPDLFAMQISRPELLYDTVVEVSERLDAAGRVLTPFGAFPRPRRYGSGPCGGGAVHRNCAAACLSESCS
jgi:5-oxoprolinase (ATP-hydrolysing)